MEFEREGHPEDDRLDRLLRFAATQPGRRPEFIECLLDSRIWVIGEDEPGSGHLNLRELRGFDGDVLIPFFSSTEAAERLDPDLTGLVVKSQDVVSRR